MKAMLKRVLSMALAIVMVIGLIPAVATHVHAASIDFSGFADTTIGLSATDTTLSTLGQKGTITWTATETGVTGVAKGNGGIFKVAANSTLTITNNGADGQLIFDWALTGSGSVTGGIVSGTSGSYSGSLTGGSSATISIQSDKGDYSCTLTISNLRIIRDTGAITSTFMPGENGSYTVDGTAITAATELSKSATESYAMVATPASGYQFLGWYNETAGKYESYSATAALNLDVASTIQPVFVSSSAAVFGVGSAKFTDLNAANTAASAGTVKTIVLLNNGTLSAGNYTIAAGNTLLIPFDSANTLYTAKGDGGRVTTYETPSVYRKLTLASGVNITVNGAISVSANHCAGGSANAQISYCGTPTGPCGFMDMTAGSAITINNGGALYAWGFITGAGSITAKSGSTVYENMQVSDFRGGTATTAMTGGLNIPIIGVEAIECGGTFPFSQYYVQNIEAKLTLEHGANEYATTSLTMSGSQFSSTVKFIGSDALFTIESGSVSKMYDGTKDRLSLEVNGSVKLNPMNLEISSQKINSGNYTLPITSNITITVKNGSSVNLNQNLSLLPGSEVYVEEGANMTVPEGYSMYIYDADEWSNYYRAEGENFVKYTNGAFVNQGKKFIPIAYAPGQKYTRVLADVEKDAKVVLDGTLEIFGGTESGVFTTEGGANITSNGTGIIIMTIPTYYDDYFQNTWQVLQPNNVDPVRIRITPLKLHNGNGDYTETYDCVEYDFYAWNSACNKWTKNAMDEHTYESKIYAPTCTEDGYTAQTCIYCDHEGEHTDIVAATGHSYDDVVTAPTCTAQGYTTHTCSVCGDSYVDTYVDATGHTFVAGTVVAPTCTAQGYTVYSCSCGATENRDYVDAAGHSYNAIVTAPTCTAKGYTTYTCACGDSYVGDEVNALGHTEVTVAGTPATCTATGLTDGKACSVCGTTTVAQEVIPVLPHSEVIDEAVAPGCETTGLTEGKHCSVCGTVIVAQTEVAALGHSWDEGVVTDAPDCNNAGVMTYTCGTCGDTRTEAIDATGHTEVVDAAVAPTCTTTGLTEGKHCSVCGTVTVAQTEVAALGHTYETVVTAPTCDANGYTTYTCHCGDSYVADEVAALGHKWVILSAEPATCTEDGFEKFYCENCNETSTTVISATGHSWGEEVVVDPTCTEAGYTKKTCTNDNCGAEERYGEVSATGHTYDAVRTEPTCTVDGSVVYTCHCGDTYTETITATGHTYESIVTEPTCTEQGYTTYTCHCGDSYVDDYVDAAGHDYTEFVETVEPTCTEGGYTVYECECGATENRDFVDALGHSYESVVTDPTCTTGGYTTHTCSVCGNSRIDSQTEALGHAYGEWETVTEATCTTDGLKKQVCANGCGQDKTEVIAHAGHTEETITGKEPTCTEPGLTEGVKCSVCGETLTEQEEIPATGEHNYVDGKCDMCGAADPDAVKLFDLSGTFMVLGNSLQINFAVDTAKLEGTDNYAVVTKEYADREAVTVTIPQSEWLKYSGNVYYFSFNGVAAKEMTDDLTVIVYNADGVQMTNTKVDSIEDYCVRMLRKSTKAEERTVFVDMLNYGAAAQNYFEYKQDDLANAQLTEEEQKYATQSVTMEDNRVKGEGYAGTLPILKCEIILNFVYNNSVINKAAYAVATYTNHYGNVKSMTYQAEEFITYNASMKYVPVSGMSVADFGQPVTVKLYDADGKVLSTSVDSLESYIARMAEGGDEIFEAVMKFAAGAYNYFH